MTSETCLLFHVSCHQSYRISLTLIDPVPFSLSSLRPICTEKLPGVAAHDSLFVVSRSGVAVPSRARAQN